METEFKDIAKSRREWNPPSKERDVHYRTTVHHPRDTERHLVVIRIGAEVMKKLGWKAGDKAKLMQSINDPKILYLVEDPDQGYTLFPAVTNDRHPYQEQLGSPVRSYFHGTLDESHSLPDTHGRTIQIQNFTVTDEGLMIRVPRMGATPPEQKNITEQSHED